MNGKFYFTRRGLAKLQGEIKELGKKLQELQSQTAYVAEVGGDQWHDNAAYESLVIDIRGIDRRLSNAHQMLSRAVLIEPPTNSDSVTIGIQVKIMRDNKEMTWKIVGFGESDPDRNMLAYNTPLASLMMSRHRGEVVSGIIAGKQTEIEVLEIINGGEEDVYSS